ncbi:MAG TPA: ABC transporter permease [Streptosporangiaceae bacterium]|nr:ABC transporter permease [Streptosporangiaceae bacterium]
MSLLMIADPRAPRAGFGKIVHNEARLAWRQPSGIIVSVGVSLLLLIIFGEIPAFQVTSASLGGLSAFEVYIPILVAFVIGVLALTYLPGPLVSYREQGILRRLSTTPVPPWWVLSAQLVVQACLMVITVGILIVVSGVFFGESAPKNTGGLVLAIALSIAAMFAIGLAIAAGARTAGAARGIMMATFYPLMFFSGLYIPMQLLPGALQDISHVTPLGAAVEAIQDSMLQGFPPVAPLLVLAVYAVVFGLVAKRFFRWE